MTKKQYDVKNKRLLFFQKKADDLFWDSHWNKHNVEKVIKSIRFNHLILETTQQYLPKNSRILEGGCGLG